VSIRSSRSKKSRWGNQEGGGKAKTERKVPTSIQSERIRRARERTHRSAEKGGCIGCGLKTAARRGQGGAVITRRERGGEKGGTPEGRKKVPMES